jgi:hypothetical protein
MGRKVKASAGKSSFKRAGKLDAALSAARERVAALKTEVDAEPGASIKRREAARARAARDIEARAAKAKATLVQACPRAGGDRAGTPQARRAQS